MPRKKTTKKSKKTAKKTTKRAAKKAAQKYFKFKNTLPQDLILKWMGIKDTHPKCKAPFFWAREMKMLKNLCEKYPHEFVEKLDFEFKVDSLVVLSSDYHKNYIQKKYLEYSFKPRREYKPQKVKAKKMGEKLKTTKKKSIKDFLNSNGKRKK